MVLKKIYLFKLENGMEIFTTDKNELVDKLNEIYKENPLFVEYNIDKINNDFSKDGEILKNQKYEDLDWAELCFED